MIINSAFSKKTIWHPFTQEKIAPEVIHIDKAAGAYIYDINGKLYIDLISSWWVNIHGHANIEIAKTIYEQAQKLEHVIFAGFTHSPAINLCNNLQEILPNNLSKFFFSDNGSTAVEVAIKMAYQYWHNIFDNKRNIFLNFEGAYHGDTLGAMSVSKSSFHDIFKDLQFKTMSVPYPNTWYNDEQIEVKEQQSINALERILAKHHSEIAAMIIEPLIQGAGGMRICRPEFLKDVINIIRKYDILIIFDEVMTGFGRTGSYFALSQLDLTPDFLCISKGITGGFLPLALTITTDRIYNAFLGDDFKLAFAHGHSYTANPIACSAAITSLKLLRENKCTQAIVDINKAHIEGLEYLNYKCKDKIEHLRNIGTIAAFNIKNHDKINTLKEKFLLEGLLIRPLGNNIYILPPYCITKEELARIYIKIADIINTMV